LTGLGYSNVQIDAMLAGVAVAWHIDTIRAIALAT